MRLHLLAAVALVGLGLAGTASAEIDHSDSAKPLEPAVRQVKKASIFAPQAPLFVEQKETPTASKTSLHFNIAARLSDKSKD